jgi:hypothetical protein
VIEIKEGAVPGQTKIVCKECGKYHLLLNWMPCDMWNDVVREFKEKHKNCGEVNGQTSL